MSYSNPERWEGGLGNWLIYEDGSMLRIEKVPDDVYKMAEERGIKLDLAPDFVPAADVDKYRETRKIAVPGPQPGKDFFRCSA